MAITELKPYLSNLAEKLKSLLGITDKINAQDFPDKVSEVYEKSRFDTWNKITNNNTRVFYSNSFRGMPDGSFDPPFALKPINAEAMFRECKQKKITTEQLDLSACGNFPYGFYGSALEELGIIDLSFNSNNSSVFYACEKLHTIEKVIFKEDGTSKTDASNLFTTTSLKNITIGGKIGVSTGFSYCPLTNDSAKSVINALKDYSGTDKEFAYTLTLKSTVKDALIAEGATAPNGLTWDEYVLSKKWNW